MRKYIILAFITLSALSACKKDQKATPDNEVTIVGTWTVSSGIYDYYDDNNNKLYSEDGGDKGTLFNFKDNSEVTISFNNTTMSGSYIVARNNNKNYLTLTSGVDSQVYEIINLTGSFMEIKLTTSPDMYYESGVLKNAAKSVYTVKLSR